MTAHLLLDNPLPAELAGRDHGWFTRYRRYPVFSAPWVRGRLRLMTAIVGSVMLLMLGAVLATPPADRPWPGLAEMALTLVVPMLAGPWLGLRVRRQGWSEQRERWTLLALMLAIAMATAAFAAFLSEPTKQWVAERTGNVDANGKRRRVVMMIGVNISTPDRPGGVMDADDAAAPTWHATSIAIRSAVAFLLAGGLALRGLRRETEGLRQLEREQALADAQAKRREAELRLSVLAAQVEPHFLFNTLAGVRSAIATDPARASEMIDRLVDYLRAAIPRLRGSSVEQATVGAQFEIVRAYLGLMAARLPRLAYALTCPPDLLQARCPPLMLISLAENAVKHGVELKIGAVRVELRAERSEDGRLAITVEDDGVGFAPSQSGSGLGLANIRERLAQLFGERASLALKARPGGGVAATITLPLETAA